MSTDHVASTELAPADIVVTRGNPTDEELAAVVAVVLGLRAAQRRRPLPPELAQIAGGWNSYDRIVRRPLSPGVSAWRSTYRH